MLILIKSSLSISVYFVVYASGVVTEKPLHNPVSQKFSPFSFRKLIVFSFN